jgi:hypothetical protein
VVELRVDKFRPGPGQLQFYVAVVDGTIRKAGIHARPPSGSGCAPAARDALGSSTAAMAVSTVSYENLPAAERAALPPAELIETAAMSVATETCLP